MTLTLERGERKGERKGERRLGPPYLLRLPGGGLLDPSAGRGGGGGGDLRDGGGRLRAVGGGAGLRGDGGGRGVAHQAHAALDLDVGVALHRHVEDLEAVVVEAGQLALEGAAAILLHAADLNGGLAVEDSELAPCGEQALHTCESV